MPESDNQELYRRNPKWKSLTISCLVSLISVFFTQFTLFLLPLFLPASSFLILLTLSATAIAIVLGLRRCCNQIAGVRASAPAFVFFSIFFIWAVYFSTVRRVISSLADILFNIETLMVTMGLCCIMASDPGFVTHQSSGHGLVVESPLNEVETDGEELKISVYDVHQETQAEEGCTEYRRVRYCRHCKMYILGFDHHCPAFGNCIGQKNHLFFMVLLVGFLIMEASYVSFAFQFITKSLGLSEVGNEGYISGYLVLSTMMFSLIQVLWQAIFLMWHIHCTCFNIKTDEWINWEKYPEFQTKTIPHEGRPKTGPKFVNPYNKGILRNLKEFLTAKG